MLRRDHGLPAARALLQDFAQRYTALEGNAAALAALDARLDGSMNLAGTPSAHVRCIARLLRPLDMPGAPQDVPSCLASVPAFLKPTEWLRQVLEPAADE